MLGIIIYSTKFFVLGKFEGMELVFFIGYFGGTGDDMGCPSVGLTVGGIMIVSEISIMKSNETSPVSCSA